MRVRPVIKLDPPSSPGHASPLGLPTRINLLHKPRRVLSQIPRLPRRHRSGSELVAQQRIHLPGMLVRQRRGHSQDPPSAIQLNLTLPHGIQNPRHPPSQIDGITNPPLHLHRRHPKRRRQLLSQPPPLPLVRSQRGKKRHLVSINPSPPRPHRGGGIRNSPRTIHT